MGSLVFVFGCLSFNITMTWDLFYGKGLVPNLGSNRKITCVFVKCMTRLIGWVGFNKVMFISFNNDKYNLLISSWKNHFVIILFYFIYKIIKEKIFTPNMFEILLLKSIITQPET